MNEVPRINLHELAGLIERFLPVERWEFRKSAQFIGSPYQAVLGSVTGSPVIVYDSEWCRVRFSVQRERHNDSLWVYYGRLHASNDDWVMNWKGEDCNCWHWDVHQLILKFLDGNSPAEAVVKRGKDPEGLKEFRKLGLENTVDDFEYSLKYHAAIWNYYGNRLFELFDLQQPELWERYTQFIKEFYDRHRRSPNIQPPLDKVC